MVERLREEEAPHESPKVELHAKAPVRVFATQAIREVTARNDFDGPDVGGGSRNQRGRMRVRVELLPLGRAGLARAATILRNAILGAVRVPVIVLETQSVPRARQDPCAKISANTTLRVINRDGGI